MLKVQCMIIHLNINNRHVTSASLLCTSMHAAKPMSWWLNLNRGVDHSFKVPEDSRMTPFQISKAHLSKQHPIFSNSIRIQHWSFVPSQPRNVQLLLRIPIVWCIGAHSVLNRRDPSPSESFAGSHIIPWYLLLFCTALFQLLSYCHMIFEKKWWKMIWISVFAGGWSAWSQQRQMIHTYKTS